MKSKHLSSVLLLIAITLFLVSPCQVLAETASGDVNLQPVHTCEYVAGDVITEPTFSSAGEQLSICSICGNSVVEEVAPLVGKVSQWNVSLDDNFAVNFYLQISESITDTAKVKITTGNTTKTYTVSQLTQTESGLFCATVRIPAAQINEYIVVVVLNEGDIGNAATYSVRQYCKIVLANNNYSKYHEIIRQMLNYSAMAQIYFDYDANNLANEGITGFAVQEIPDTAEALVLSDDLSGLDFYGASLVFEDKIAVRYYFQGNVNDCSFTANGNTYTPISKDQQYYVEVPGILPQNLDEQISLAVTDRDGKELIVEYSPMSYIVRMNQKGSDDLRNLVKALYNYHLVAKTLELPYIQISSAEDLYALSRILAPYRTKENFFGTGYNTNQDLSRFEFPDDVVGSYAKTLYLSSAAYELTSDIVLTMQRKEDLTYFIGIGSNNLPFQGTFQGNGKTITLQAADKIAVNGNMNPSVGLFGEVKNATISNVNICIESDILINRCTSKLQFGILAGMVTESQIENCHVTVSNAKVGVDFAAGEKYTNQVHLGGLVGECRLTKIQNSSVVFTDAALYANGYDVSANSAMYAFFSVGGIVGFSKPGSDNTSNIGRVGNQILGCKFVSHNSTQRDVIFASLEVGSEVTAGGIVGCTFNNFVAKDCSVEISNGNIVAQKTGQTDDAVFGTNAGGIIGRLEHTGELYGCTVNGNHLNIISRSPENESRAGGIVGVDIGPYHRDVVSINNCHFDGNGTSSIVLDVRADDSKDKVIALGGVVGEGHYKIKDCTAKNVTLINHSENVSRSYTGGICGIFNRNKSLQDKAEYFTPGVSELICCAFNNMFFDTTNNVTVNEDIGRHWYK